MQRDAPVDFLLGTDIQPLLGFHLTQVEPSGKTTDLLGARNQPRAENEEGVPSAKQPASDPDQQPPGEELQAASHMCLVQIVPVPSRFSKLVKVEVDGPREGSLSLFEPGQSFLDDAGLVVEDSLISQGKGGALVVITLSTEVVVLEHGKRTGAALPASWIAELEVLQKENPEIEKHSQGLVQSILVSSPKEKQERIQQLIESLGVGHLDTSVGAQLKALLREFHDGFALSDEELGCTDVITHTIDKEGTSPIRQPPRCIPFALHSKVEEMVAGMLDQGIVQPSQSPWASPIVLGAKKDGSTHFCVDYRRLNAATKMDMYPLPHTDDCLDLLANN